MLKTLIVGPLEVNCYILWDSNSREAFVIDPGGDAKDIKEALAQDKIKAKYIINTHGHFDHVGGNAELKSESGAPLAIHASDAVLLEDAHEHAVMFGVKTPKQPAPDILLEDGAVLEAGAIKLRVIHTPGHTRGGICLYDEAHGLLFTGDTLFAGSIGRTDFPGGSYEEIMRSIKTRILTLGDGVKVYPGHGPGSTIGEEKLENPFITGLHS